MKYLIPIILILSTLVSCSSNKLSPSYYNNSIIHNSFLNNNDLEKELLIGDVQKYTTYDIVSLDKKSSQTKKIKQQADFNKRGFIIHSEIYNTKGELSRSIDNKYIADTILFTSKDVDKVSNNYVIRNYTTIPVKKENDDKLQGWKRIEHSNFNGIYTTQIIAIVDTNNYLVEQTYIQNGDIIKSTAHKNEYNTHHQITKSTITISGSHLGDFTAITNYTYDHKGNLVEKSTPELNYDKITYRYNKKNAIIKSTKYTQKPVMLSEVKMGNNIQPEFIIIETHYDKFHNPIKEDTYNIDKSLIKSVKTKYKYDATGNWVEQTIYTKEKSKWEPSNTLQREIIYYNN